MAEGAVDIAELLDRAAAERPDAPALTVDEATVSFAELRDLSKQAASRLQAMGARPDTLIALPMGNSIAQTAFFFGCWRLGATPFPISPMVPDVELDQIVAAAGSTVVVRGDPDLAGAPLWDGPYRTAARYRAQTSGGSTGVPKVIVDTQPAAVDIEKPSRFWGWTAGPAMFVPGPTFHSGPMNHMIEGLIRGRHVITMLRFDAGRAAALIAAHRPHFALFVPTMMSRLLKLPEEVLATIDFGAFTHVWHSAASCPSWLKQAWIDRVGPPAVWEIFGGSEGTATTVISGTEWLEHKGSVGRCAAGEIAIFDEAGQPAFNGVVGEIYMRNRSGERRFQVLGEVARRMNGEWESFGDLGWLDDDGYLFLADRRVDMINNGGQNVYPAEVEAAILRFPGIGDAVVFGQADEDLGEIVCALVWAEEEGVTEASLREFLATQINRYKIPRRIAFADGPIRNDAGKVRRKELSIAN